MAIENVSFQINSNADDVLKQLSQIDSMLSALNKAKAQIQLDITNLSSVNKAVDELDATLRSLTKTSHQLNVDAKISDDLDNSLSRIQKSIDEINSDKVIIRTDSSQAEQTSNLLNRILDEMQVLNKIKSMVQLNYDEIINCQDAIQDIQDKLDELDRQKTTITVESNLAEIGNSLDNIGSKMLDIVNPLSGSIGSIVSSLSVFSLLNSAFDTLASHMDDAISRFDTLNRYPKVLTALGHSLEDATASVSDLALGIEGLPTALDDIVSWNQRLTSITGDLERSTQLTLALNNAFLASGATTSDVYRGFNQFVQMLSNNDVDLRSWRTLMETMPVSLTKVANAFGYFGDSAMLDLYNAINDGKLTYREFSDQLIELGYDMGELAQLAKTNSAGIGTSFNNLGLAVTKGLANIFSQLDEYSQKITGYGIAENIDNLKYGINSLFSLIIDNMYMIEPYLERAYEWFQNFKQSVKDFAWGDFFAGLGEGFSSLKNTLSGIKNLLSPIINLLKSIITSYGGGSFAKGLGKLPALYLKIAVALKALGKVLKVVSKFTGGLFGNSKKSSSSKSVFNINSALNQLKNVAVIYGYVVTFGKLVDVVSDIDKKLPTNVGEFVLKLTNLSLAIGVMGTFTYAASKIFGGNLKSAITGLAVVTAISLELMLAAEAIRQLNNKIPNGIAKFASKIASMTIALVAMGAIIVVAGNLAAANPAAAIAGVIVVTAISLELMLAAEAIRQLDKKIPSDIAKFSKKIANLAIAIGAMTAIVAIVGALVATGVGALIGAAGVITIALFAADLLLVAEAIHQFDKKVPSNLDGVKKKFESLFEILDIFRENATANLFTVISDFFSVIDIAVISAGISSLISVARKINTLGDIKISNKGTSNVNKILEIVEEFTGTRLRDLISDILTAADINVINNSMDAIIDIAKKINEIDDIKLNTDNVKDVISELNEVIRLIGYAGLREIIAEILKREELVQVSNTLDALSEVAEKLQYFDNFEFRPLITEKKIGYITDVIKQLSDSSLRETISAGIRAKEVENLLNVVNLYVELLEPLKKIDEFEFRPRITAMKIGYVQEILEAIDSSSRAAIKDTAFRGSELENILDIVNSFYEIILSLNKIDETSFRPRILTEKIGYVQEIISSIESASRSDVTSSAFRSTQLEYITSTIDSFRNIIIELNKIDDIPFRPRIVSMKIGYVEEVLSSISGTKWQNIIASFGKEFQLSIIMNVLEEFSLIIDLLNELDDKSFRPRIVSLKIGYIADILESISGGRLADIVKNVGKDFELRTALNILYAIVELLEPIQEIERFEFNSKRTINTIGFISEVVTELIKSKVFTIANEGLDFSGIKDIASALEDVTELIPHIKYISVNNFDGEIAKEKIKDIADIIEFLVDTDISNYAYALSGGDIHELEEIFDTIRKVAIKLKQIANIEFDRDAIISLIDDIETVLNRLGGLNYEDNAESVEKFVETIKSLISTLNGLKDEMFDVGTNYADSMYQGFEIYDLPGKIYIIFDGIITELYKYGEQFKELGTMYGEELRNAFDKAISTMHESVYNQLQFMKELTSAFYNLGLSLGRNIVNGFNSTISGLSTSVASQVSNIQSSLNSITAPTLSVNVGSNYSTRYIASGGEVSYLSGGGSAGIFKKRGTDIVPAMLTPGEYVHNKSAVKYFGLDFMESVNNLDVSGAFKSLTGGFGIGRTMVNNNYSSHNEQKVYNNTTTANVTQNITGSGNGGYSVARMGRYLKARI